MFDGLLGKISDIFGKKSTTATARNGDSKKARIKQVYESHCRQIPPWAEGLESAQVIQACMAHVECKFHPHIEFKRIMSTRTGPDGNLEPEYDGVAAGCGAVKNFGLKVAKSDGYIQAYRYVNLEHIYSCCCGNPRRCLFYLHAVGESQDLAAQRRRL